MAFLAIAYPVIESSDFEWIQDIRKLHDRQFDLVNPHITLVFGTNKLNLSEFTKHIQSKVRTFKSFKVTMDSAKTIEGNSIDDCHAFLIPSVGFNEINELHDLLYQDELESELRRDMPFIPHLTIGSGSKEEMTVLVNKVNEQRISINGNVGEVNIISFDGSKVKDINMLSLV
ncbi:MAG: 2'-5' RNA ligase family protein [Candidatus Saccharibacteria bacterium]